MHEMGDRSGRCRATLWRTYRGVGRRFDLKGEADGITVIDDYAHHPQEIAATIAAARERYPDRRIVAAFQPHTYSRTKALLDPFATCSGRRRLRRWCWISIRRAKPTRSASPSDDIISPHEFGDHDGWWHSCPGRRPACTPKLVTGDVILTLGAGDVTLVGPKLLALLKEQS